MDLKNVICLDGEDFSHQILDLLKGKKFCAISYDVDTDSFTIYQNKMSAHEAVFGMTQAISDLIK